MSKNRQSSANNSFKPPLVLTSAQNLQWFPWLSSSCVMCRWKHLHSVQYDIMRTLLEHTNPNIWFKSKQGFKIKERQSNTKQNPEYWNQKAVSNTVMRLLNYNSHSFACMILINSIHPLQLSSDLSLWSLKSIKSCVTLELSTNIGVFSLNHVMSVFNFQIALF